VTVGPSTTVSVVVSTYEWPDALDAVLRGLGAQSDSSFDVVVADDGSGPETEETVARWRAVFGERLVHVWQPDEGFRLARVRNLGAANARGSYLVFMDGDCIPRRHFVAAIRRGSIPGWFVAGTRVQLGKGLSHAVLRDGVPIGSWSTATLLARGRRDIQGWRHLTPRDRRRAWRPRLPDFAAHGNAYGFCMGVARTDFEALNGFDMRFVGWGDQDVDLAVRLRRLGLRCGYAGPRSALLHLWHPSHVPEDRPTWWLLQDTISSGRVEAITGYRELVARVVENDVAVTPRSTHQPAAGCRQNE
jgi:glycosyltransferase involved in cell wall biosynthesis